MSDSFKDDLRQMWMKNDLNKGKVKVINKGSNMRKKQLI